MFKKAEERNEEESEELRINYHNISLFNQKQAQMNQSLIQELQLRGSGSQPQLLQEYMTVGQLSYPKDRKWLAAQKKLYWFNY